MSELNSNYYINLDIHRIESNEVISMTQGDSGRRIVITFSESGVPFNLSDVNKAFFTGTKSDGKKIYNSCEIDKINNTIMYNITSQTSTALGIVECQILLVDEDGKAIAAPKFSIVVGNKTVSDDYIESSDEFNVMIAYIKILENMIDDLNKKLAAGEFRGEPFTYDDFTNEQLEALKVGAVNVSDVYNADSHQAQSGIAVTSAINGAKAEAAAAIDAAKEDIRAQLVLRDAVFATKIAKYGSTNEWDWEKYPNGKVRVSRIFVSENDVLCDKGWNNTLYYGDPIILPDYPFEFTKEPDLEIRFLGSTPEMTAFFTWDHKNTENSEDKNDKSNCLKSPGEVFLYRPTSGNTLKKPRISIVAEGWIKEEAEELQEA